MNSEENVSPNGTDSKASTTKKRPSAFRRFLKKHPIFTTVVAGLIAVVLVYFGKDIQGNIQKKALVKEANTELRQNNEALAKLIAKPLVWSIRSEMLRGNMEQVSQLITDLVKGSQVQFIHLLDQNGTVKLSTNKNREGQPIAEEAIKAVLKADSTSLVGAEDHLVTVVSPIMDYDKRLGTLVVGVSYQAFHPDGQKK
jgi:sensor histidine kinase regulating citrate/malate metabolism